MANLKLNTIVYNGVNYLDLPDSATNVRDSFMHESIFSQLVSGANLDSFVINNKTISYLETGVYPTIRLGNRVNVSVPMETLAAINRTSSLFSANTDVYLNGKLIDKDTTIEIGEVEEINKNLFSYMQEGKLIFKSNIIKIGSTAFQYNTRLTEIVFEGDVGTISSNCFYLNNLTKVTFKGNVESIANQAFYIPSTRDCVFDFSNATSIPYLQNYSGIGVRGKNLTIIVPDALYDDWILATNWSNFKDYTRKASEIEN